MVVAGMGTISPMGQPSWNGSGIMTSQTTASTSMLTTLAVAAASDVKNISGAQTALFGGLTVTPTDTLVMYTYGGDANLDGKIDADDYFVRSTANYNKSGQPSLRLLQWRLQLRRKDQWRRLFHHRLQFREPRRRIPGGGAGDLRRPIAGWSGRRARAGVAGTVCPRPLVVGTSAPASELSLLSLEGGGSVRYEPPPS